MHSTTFMAVLILSLAVPIVPLDAKAQEGGKVARIGYLALGSPRGDPLAEAFKQGLRELGYVEGRNVSIEYRAAEGRDERLPGLAADLVRLKVDVIVAPSRAALAAKQATTAIPIVMPIITDPVRLGLVASLARPAGNATGFATQNDELPGKWLELVKETLPKISRVAILLDPDIRRRRPIESRGGRGAIPGCEPSGAEGGAPGRSRDRLHGSADESRRSPHRFVVTGFLCSENSHRRIRGQAPATDNLPLSGVCRGFRRAHILWARFP